MKKFSEIGSHRGALCTIKRGGTDRGTPCTFHSSLSEAKNLFGYRVLLNQKQALDCSRAKTDWNLGPGIDSKFEHTPALVLDHGQNQWTSKQPDPVR